MTPPVGGPAQDAGDSAAARASDSILPLERAASGGAAGPSIATGFPSLDNLLGGGLRRGDLVVLGGDVGVGKSSLALAMALRSAAAGHTVAFFSGEMTTARLVERALAAQARVAVDDLRRGILNDDHRESIAGAMDVLSVKAPALVQLTDPGVSGVSDFLVERLGLELAIVDPLQFLALGVAPLEEEIARATRALKELAIRRMASMLVTSHLGRAVRDRANPRPALEDFAGLGSIRQHADVVLGLYREELYDPSPHVEGAAELHVLKNRNGPTGFVDLYFYKQWLRFEDMIEPDR
jgi:replicative DNA helicase